MSMVIIMLLMAILRKVYDDWFPSVAALPGVARLVHHLAKHQVRNSNFIHLIPSPLVVDVLYTRVSKFISYTWMQGLSIALQNIRSVSATFKSFRHILSLLVANVNSRVSKLITYT